MAIPVQDLERMRLEQLRQELRNERERSQRLIQQLHASDAVIADIAAHRAELEEEFQQMRQGRAAEALLGRYSAVRAYTAEDMQRWLRDCGHELTLDNTRVLLGKLVAEGRARQTTGGYVAATAVLDAVESGSIKLPERVALEGFVEEAASYQERPEDLTDNSRWMWDRISAGHRGLPTPILHPWSS